VDTVGSCGCRSLSSRSIRTESIMVSNLVAATNLRMPGKEEVVEGKDVVGEGTVGGAATSGK